MTIVASPTPGPWEISGRGYTIFGSDGVCVAEAYDGYDEVGDEHDVEQRAYEAEQRAIANAQLIAAAPELLEALQAIVDEPIYGVDTSAHDEASHGHTGQEWALLRWADVTKEVARQAIAKIKGY